MSVYVGGASADMPRAQWATDALRGAGIEVVSTWLEVVAQVGQVNPADARWEDRYRWSITDLDEVRRADYLWFLVPAKGVETLGAPVELGFKHAFSQVTGSLGARIISSGPTKRTIFCALGEEFEDDQQALAWLIARHRRQLEIKLNGSPSVSPLTPSAPRWNRDAETAEWRAAAGNRLPELADDLERRGLKVNRSQLTSSYLEAAFGALNVDLAVRISTIYNEPFSVALHDHHSKTIIRSHSATYEGVLRLVDVFLAGSKAHTASSVG